MAKMKLAFFDDFKLCVVKGDNIVDVTARKRVATTIGRVVNFGAANVAATARPTSGRARDGMSRRSADQDATLDGPGACRS